MDKQELEPGMLDNVPDEFLARARWSERFQGCIELSSEFGELHAEVTPTTAPYTYRGMRGKATAMEGKTGEKMRPREKIKATCRNRFCIRQDHLIVAGFTSERSVPRA